MNYQAIQEAAQRCERCERYVKSVSALSKRAGEEVKAGPGATYRMLKTLFATCAYDHPDFEEFFMPSDLLLDLIQRAAERTHGTLQKKLEESKALVREGFEVDEIAKKGKKA
jgi:hypothetical protein